MRIKLNVALEQQIALLPESGMGYHRVYLYLRGPHPSKQQFRFKTFVYGGQEMDWYSELGKPEEYSFEKFTKI